MTMTALAITYCRENNCLPMLANIPTNVCWPYFSQLKCLGCNESLFLAPVEGYAGPSAHYAALWAFSGPPGLLPTSFPIEGGNKETKCQTRPWSLWSRINQSPKSLERRVYRLQSRVNHGLTLFWSKY